jgi:Flp pilus assembly protein TadD
MTSLVLAISVAGACAGIQASADGTPAPIKVGDDYLNQDRLHEAITAYANAVRTDPKDSVAHQRLGHAYALDRRMADAIDELRESIQLDPNNARAHLDLGWVYGMDGQLRAAATEEEIAMKLSPNAPAFTNLGIALTELGEFDGAAVALKRAIEFEPQNADSYGNMASLLARRGDYKGSIEYYRRAISLNHTDASAHIGLGSALGRTGDLHGQVEEYKKAAAIAPKNANAHGKLGWALYRVGDWTGAIVEGFAANGLRVQQSSSNFFGSLLTAWAALFLVFGVIFAAIFLGSDFKPQSDEEVVRSFFLVFYKDRPGRFVITNRRLVFVPEAFSKWFGATRLGIERVDVEAFYSQTSVTGGRLALLCTNGSVIHFMMPVLVLEPLVAELKKQQYGNREYVAAAVSAAGSTEEGGTGGSSGNAGGEGTEDEPFEAPEFDAEDTGWVEVVTSSVHLETVKEKLSPKDSAKEGDSAEPGEKKAEEVRSGDKPEVASD